MQATVKHQCGHTSQVQLYGSSRDRERKMAWLHQQPCPDCRRAAQATETAKATEDLVTLTGSPKQIAWATKIQAEFLADMKQRTPDTDEGRTAYSLLKQAVNTKPAAAWWIDNRSNLRAALKEAYTAVLDEAN
ncbi:MAG: hypothetical protein ABFE07_29675 [Armatimonadia bacterium]